MNRKTTIYFASLFVLGLFTISSCQVDDGETCTGQRWYEDADGDGKGNGDVDEDGLPVASIFTCDQPDGYVSNSSDTNDEDPGDCERTIWYEDADGDGFGNGNIDVNGLLVATTIFTCEQPDGFVDNKTDTNDNDVEIVCEGKLWYEDTDGDGYGSSELNVNTEEVEGQDDIVTLLSPVFACEQPDGFVDNSDDQDVDNPNVQNCTGLTWYQDNDEDGLGNFDVTIISCEQLDGYVDNADDLDDTDAEINCTGILFYEDADGDGFGNTLVRQFACTAADATEASGTSNAYVENNTDSDDTDPDSEDSEDNEDTEDS